MLGCGYVIHKTMPLALARQSEMVRLQEGTTPSNTLSSLLPKISTQYKRLIPPPSTSFWYMRAWGFLKRKMSDDSFKNVN